VALTFQGSGLVVDSFLLWAGLFGTVVAIVVNIMISVIPAREYIDPQRKHYYVFVGVWRDFIRTLHSYIWAKNGHC
jgi:hypothetical protein